MPIKSLVGAQTPEEKARERVLYDPTMIPQTPEPFVAMGTPGWSGQSWLQKPFTALEAPWDLFMGLIRKTLFPETAPAASEAWDLVLQGKGRDVVSGLADELLGLIGQEKKPTYGEWEDPITGEMHKFQTGFSDTWQREVLTFALQLADPVTGLLSFVAPTKLGAALKAVPSGIRPTTFVKWMKNPAHLVKATPKEQRALATLKPILGELLAKKASKIPFTKIEEQTFKIMTSKAAKEIAPWSARWGVIGLDPSGIIFPVLRRLRPGAEALIGKMGATSVSEAFGKYFPHLLEQFPFIGKSEAIAKLTNYANFVPGQILGAGVKKIYTTLPLLEPIGKWMGKWKTELFDFSRGLAKRAPEEWGDLQRLKSAIAEGKGEFQNAADEAGRILARIERKFGAEIPAPLAELLHRVPLLLTLPPEKFPEALKILGKGQIASEILENGDYLNKLIAPASFANKLKSWVVGIAGLGDRLRKSYPGKDIQKQIAGGQALKTRVMMLTKNEAVKLADITSKFNEVPHVAADLTEHALVRLSFRDMLRKAGKDRIITAKELDHVFAPLYGREYVSTTQEFFADTQKSLMSKLGKGKGKLLPSDILNAMKEMTADNVNLRTSLIADADNIKELLGWTQGARQSIDPRELYPGYKAYFTKEGKRTEKLAIPPSMIEQATGGKYVGVVAEGLEEATEGIHKIYASRVAELLQDGYHLKGYHPNTYSPVGTILPDVLARDRALREELGKDAYELLHPYVIKYGTSGELNAVNVLQGMPSLFEEEPIKAFLASYKKSASDFSQESMLRMMRDSRNLSIPAKEVLPARAGALQKMGWTERTITTVREGEKPLKEKFWVIPEYAKWLDEPLEPKMNRLLEGIHWFGNHFMKPIMLLSPAVHPRNFVGSASALAFHNALNMGDFATALKNYNSYAFATGSSSPLLKRAAEATRRFFGIKVDPKDVLAKLDKKMVDVFLRDAENPMGVTQKWSWKRLLDTVREMGVYGRTHIEDRLSLELSKNASICQRLGFHGKRLVEGNYGLMSLNDDIFKTSGILTLMKQGVPLDEAGATVKRALVDYGTLTKWERKYMKAFFPFYTWTRKTGEWMAEKVFTGTPAYATGWKSYEAWRNAFSSGYNIPEEDLPEWGKNALGLPWRYNATTKQATMFYLGRWLPIGDVIRMGDAIGQIYGAVASSAFGVTQDIKPGKVGYPQIAAEALHPLLRMGIEGATGAKLLNSMPLYAYSGDAKTFWGVDGFPPWITNVLRAVGVARDLNKLLDKEEKGADRALNFFTGIYLTTVDGMKQRRIHNAQIQEEIKHLYNGITNLKFRGEYAKIERLEKEIERYRRLKVGVYEEAYRE